MGASRRDSELRGLRGCSTASGTQPEVQVEATQAVGPGTIAKPGPAASASVPTSPWLNRRTLPLHAHAAPRVTVHPRLKSQVESAPAGPSGTATGSGSEVRR
jgi:hypothetical protein